MTDFSITPVEELIDEGTPVLDVRTPEEFADGHIPGAKNIFLSESAEDNYRGSIVLIDIGGVRSRNLLMEIKP